MGGGGHGQRWRWAPRRRRYAGPEVVEAVTGILLVGQAVAQGDIGVLLLVNLLVVELLPSHN